MKRHYEVFRLLSERLDEVQQNIQRDGDHCDGSMAFQTRCRCRVFTRLLDQIDQAVSAQHMTAGEAVGDVRQEVREAASIILTPTGAT